MNSRESLASKKTRFVAVGIKVASLPSDFRVRNYEVYLKYNYCRPTFITSNRKWTLNCGVDDNDDVILSHMNFSNNNNIIATI